jgi:hypothetical protein
MHLTYLHQTGHLLPATDAAYWQREQRALAALQRQPQPTYLQQYDLLFRWVSLWLLQRGYRLSGHQPHQVLARVCEQFASAELVRGLVRGRHALKYDPSGPGGQRTAHASRTTSPVGGGSGCKF